jgi:NAD(P)-dependent dehydrogenase (short-subunit alcohol dehydrogenase family)
MANALQHRTILVVGRGSGIARAVTLSARSEGARVIVAGRDRGNLASSYDDDGITAAHLDITDDDSIAALADTVGPLDHVVSTASRPREVARSRAPEPAGVIDTGAWGRHGRRGKEGLLQTDCVP